MNSLVRGLLNTVRLSSVYFDECLADLNSLYSYKYGESVPQFKENTLKWYKGNLTINIYTLKDVEKNIH